MKGKRINTNLLDGLKKWDGKHIKYLTKLYQTNSGDPSFPENLVAIIINEKDLQKTATWLIKHHYDNGQTLSPLLIEKLLKVCGNVDNWEAKLHLLQLLPHFKLTHNTLLSTENFVRACLNDSNKFVRAWTYNGLYELTKYIPELKTEVEFLCQRALETESAAVQARVRKILLELNRKQNN